MSCTPEAEMESHNARVIPLHRGYVVRETSAGRYGVDPAPVAEEDGEPLTFGELLRFWGVVWACCVLGGRAWGALIAALRSAQ